MSDNIKKWRERDYEVEHSDVAMQAEIDDLRAELAHRDAVALPDFYINEWWQGEGSERYVHRGTEPKWNGREPTNTVACYTRPAVVSEGQAVAEPEWFVFDHWGDDKVQFRRKPQVIDEPGRYYICLEDWKPLYTRPAAPAPEALTAAQAPEVATDENLEPAPPNSLPDWSDCSLRVGNSNFITKRVAEGGYGPECDSKLATELHRFIYEYDDADRYRSAWFLHRLELVIKEAQANALATQPKAAPVAEAPTEPVEIIRQVNLISIGWAECSEEQQAAYAQGDLPVRTLYCYTSPIAAPATEQTKPERVRSPYVLGVKRPGEPAKPNLSGLTDKQIEEIAYSACKEHELSWVGFKEDAEGFFTVPALSQCHFQLVRAILAAITKET